MHQFNGLSREKNVHIKWNYFATSHGKSSVDGVGGLTRLQLQQMIVELK